LRPERKVLLKLFALVAMSFTLAPARPHRITTIDRLNKVHLRTAYDDHRCLKRSLYLTRAVSIENAITEGGDEHDSLQNLVRIRATDRLFMELFGARTLGR